MRQTRFTSLSPLLLVMSVVPLAASAQTCPSSTIEFLPTGPSPVYSNVPARSLRSAWDLGAGSARYDLVAGTLGAASFGDPAGGFGTHARASDRYELLGPAGSPPIAFSVRLYVLGSAQGRNDGYLPGDVGSVTVSAALLEIGGAQDSSSVTASPVQFVGFDPALSIPLVREVGGPFDLVMALHSQGGFSTGMLDARISFILPLGCAIVSCKTFQGSGSTPAVKRSWGGIKLLYR